MLAGVRNVNDKSTFGVWGGGLLTFFFFFFFRMFHFHFISFHSSFEVIK